MKRGRHIFLVASVVAGLLGSLGSCRKKNHLEPHYWVKYTGTTPVSGKKDTLVLFVETLQTADTMLVIYQSAALTLKYTLSKNPEKVVRFHSPFHMSTHLTWEKDTSLRVAGQYQKLAIYKSGDGSIDGEVKHYWCPEFGIIAFYSEAWSSLWLLQTNNEERNRVIKDLALSVLPPPQQLLIEE